MLPRILPLLVMSSVCLAEDTGVAALERAITPVVQKYFPDAKVQSEGNTVVAKHGTMMFSVHNISKTGEISPKVYQEEGPNYRGFLLQISREPGSYQGAAAAPQDLRGPYWTTHFDAVPTEDGSAYWHIRFSYGGRLDPDFQKALRDTLPKRKDALK